MIAPWRVLVVDDDQDVHDVTVLALKRKVWRKRGFEVEHAYSGAEAQQMLERTLERPDQLFQLALVDVVMEDSEAGLRLCRYIRESQPRSVRIVLRTGQPGVAPPEMVLSEYDIDYYLDKQDVTQERLNAVVRACIRSSQDISTLIAFGRQLQDFTRALQDVTAAEDLLLFMNQGLRFLQTKHTVTLRLFADLASGESSALPRSLSSPEPLNGDQRGVLLRLHGEASDEPMQLTPLPTDLFGDNAHFVPFSVPNQSEPLRGALLTQTGGPLDRDSEADFLADARLFLENWQIAVQALLLKTQLERDRIVREKMHMEHLKSLAHAVTGVAHQLNTPLGIATTAASMLPSLAEQLVEEEDAEQVAGITGDMSESAALILRNLSGANQLISRFKELAVSQLYDIKMQTSLRVLFGDFIEGAAYSPGGAGAAIELIVEGADDDPFDWEGYPGHLTRVLSALVDNAQQHGNREGALPVTIRCRREAQYYLIQIEDRGAGVPEELGERLFEPFVTAKSPDGFIVGNRARGDGSVSVGLGLAVCRNIVHDLLGGRIWLQQRAQPTTFSLEIPVTLGEQQQ